jgi:hypothetical protein
MNKPSPTARWSATATLTARRTCPGINLPVERVAAASGHIDALAKAAKHAGDRRSLDYIRADLFLGMTDGTYTGLDDAAILEHLRTTHGSKDGPDDSTEDGGPDDDPGGPDDNGPEDGGEVAEGGYSEADELAQRDPAGAGMELRARLSTLPGHDQHPAELAGWRPVHAELTRELAATLGGAQWRFVITDEHGQLCHCGITATRPTGTPSRTARSRAIVELQVPATTLRALSEHPAKLGAWTNVVTDLARQLGQDRTDRDRDAHRRNPSVALRRYLEIRDRSCTMIGCRAPARTTDKDHTHGHGGPTTDNNLGNACRHDHRLKHEGGWRLRQPETGHFVWRSHAINELAEHPIGVLKAECGHMLVISSASPWIRSSTSTPWSRSTPPCGGRGALPSRRTAAYGGGPPRRFPPVRRVGCRRLGRVLVVVGVRIQGVVPRFVSFPSWFRPG